MIDMINAARDSDEIKSFQWKVLTRTPVPNEFKLVVPGTPTRKIHPVDGFFKEASPK